MQINKNSNINNLKLKIKNGFIGFLKEHKYEINEYDYKIYLSDYNQQDITNLILSYINMLKNYIIKGQQINNDNQIFNNNLSKTNLEEFLKNKYICCEVINKNTIVLPFLTLYNELKLSCPLCNLTLDLKTQNKKLYPCELCSQKIYCSEKCRSSDSSHIEFLSKLSFLCDNSLKLSDIKNINIKIF